MTEQGTTAENNAHRTWQKARLPNHDQRLHTTRSAQRSARARKAANADVANSVVNKVCRCILWLKTSAGGRMLRTSFRTRKLQTEGHSDEHHAVGGWWQPASARSLSARKRSLGESSCRVGRSAGLRRKATLCSLLRSRMLRPVTHSLSLVWFCSPGSLTHRLLSTMSDGCQQWRKRAGSRRCAFESSIGAACASGHERREGFRLFVVAHFFFQLARTQYCRRSRSDCPNNASVVPRCEERAVGRTLVVCVESCIATCLYVTENWLGKLCGRGFPQTSRSSEVRTFW